MTFTLLGRCPRSERLGIVISSSSPAVGARCAHVRPRVGVAASQNVTDPRLGPALLDALGSTGSAAGAVDSVVRDAPHIEHRQLLALGTTGDAGVYTGARALGRHAHRIGRDCAAAGNLLAGERVADALVERFEERATAELADRLVAALEAALQAGGEAGPVRSAALILTAHVPWPVVDLRIDWHPDPVAALRDLWDVYRPQVDAYVARALDPDAAPAFGVAGE